MASFLEQLQVRLLQLENRIKHLEKRLAHFDEFSDNDNKTEIKEKKRSKKKKKTNIKSWFFLLLASLVFLIFYFSYVVFTTYTIHRKLLFLGIIWFIYSFLPYIVGGWFNKEKSDFFAALLLTSSTIFVFFGIFYSIIQEPFFEFTYWPLSLLKNLVAQEIVQYLSLLFTLLNGILLLSLHAWDRKKIYLLNTLFTLFVCSVIGFIFSQWSGYQAVAAASFFASLIFMLSFICQQFFMRIYSYIIWTFCGWRLVTLLFYQIRPAALFFNEITFSLCIIEFSFIVAYWISCYKKKQLEKNERLIPFIFQGVILIVPIYWMHTKIWQFPYKIIGLAWYGLFLFIWGLVENKKVIRQSGYSSYSLALIYFAFNYFFKSLLNPYWTIWLNILCATFVIIFFITWFIVYYRSHKLSKKEYEFLEYYLDFFLVIFIFTWIRSNIILYFDVLKMQSAFFMKKLIGYSIKSDILVRQPFTQNLLLLFYAFYGILLVGISFVNKKRIIKYLGLVIIILALIKFFLILELIAKIKKPFMVSLSNHMNDRKIV